jgi:hypothetical protein
MWVGDITTKERKAGGRIGISGGRGHGSFYIGR